MREEHARAESLRDALDTTTKEAFSARETLAEAKAGLSMAREALDQAQVFWGRGIALRGDRSWCDVAVVVERIKQAAFWRRVVDQDCCVRLLSWSTRDIACLRWFSGAYRDVSLTTYVKCISA